MEKLKLKLEDLKVESFETNSKNIKKGTIVGQISGNHPDCQTQNYDPTCNPDCTQYCTYDATCQGAPGCDSMDLTCDHSCPRTCDFTCDEYVTCAYPQTCQGCT